MMYMADTVEFYYRQTKNEKLKGMCMCGKGTTGNPSLSFVTLAFDIQTEMIFF
jgi:hypothetical protein